MKARLAMLAITSLAMVLAVAGNGSAEPKSRTSLSGSSSPSTQKWVKVGWFCGLVREEELKLPLYVRGQKMRDALASSPRVMAAYPGSKRITEKLDDLVAVRNAGDGTWVLEIAAVDDPEVLEPVGLEIAETCLNMFQLQIDQWVKYKDTAIANWIDEVRDEIRRGDRSFLEESGEGSTTRPAASAKTSSQGENLNLKKEMWLQERAELLRLQNELKLERHRVELNKRHVTFVYADAKFSQ